MTTISGTLFPDTNHWHPLLDGKAVAKKGSPCIGIKIGQGSSKDVEADKSVARAEAAGLIVIGYIFGTNQDGAAQADQLAKWFPWKPGRIWCLDNEHNGPSPSDSITQAQAAACVARLHAIHPKKLWPIEYELLSTPHHGSGLRWVAQYTSVQPKGADLWQFNGGGFGIGPDPHSWSGVSGNCDMNKLIVSQSALRSAAGTEDDVELTPEQATDLTHAGGLARGILAVYDDKPGSVQAAAEDMAQDVKDAKSATATIIERLAVIEAKLGI